MFSISVLIPEGFETYGDCSEGLLGCNALQSVADQPMSGWNMTPSLQVAIRFCLLFHTSLLLGLFFDPEDGGDMFFQK
jgi:hypothetical protein